LIYLLIYFSANQCKILEKSAQQTADVLLFFDEIFDSINGSSFVHHKLWADPIRTFKSNWITTLKGFKEIVKK
jgi:hypothetical protein